MAPTLLPLLRSLTTPTPDGDLLDRFVGARDEEAFAELVRRHGPAVYRICRRLVGLGAADDAFQAAFLVLATRPVAAKSAVSVGNWLVGTAGRVARQMRRSTFRRLRHESAAAERDQTAVVDSHIEVSDDLRILDEEVTRLPDRLRAPIVLCLLQGHTQEEAAGVLGQTSRTVRRRLEEAKNRLHLRLVRRGVAPALIAGLVATIGPIAEAVGDDLVRRTISVVFGFLTGQTIMTSSPVILANGVAKTMLARKLAIFGMVAIIGLTALGIGLAGDRNPMAPPPAPAPSEAVRGVTAVPSDDELFLRQVCQKFRGTPPTTAEIAYFLADPDTKKRDKVTRWLSPNSTDRSGAVEKPRPALAPSGPATGSIPRELNKVTLPRYVIEAPDNLLIEVVVRKRHPVAGSTGKAVDDGKGNEPTKEATERLPIQAISGPFPVRIDGTVGLGYWGSVTVSGLTLDQATEAIRKHLARSQLLTKEGILVEDLAVIVDVLAYNSKKYYVIVDNPEGEEVYSIHITGSETVLDALSNVNGLHSVASKRKIWIARRTPLPDGPWQILPVDWIGLTQHGRVKTNYQIMPGDRIYMKLPDSEARASKVAMNPYAGESDLAFLLRICQDIRGTPPTTIETSYFPADTDPLKKEKMIRCVKADLRDGLHVGEHRVAPDREGKTPASSLPPFEVIAENGKVTVKGQNFEAVARSFRLTTDRRMEFTGTDQEPVRFQHWPNGRSQSKTILTSQRVLFEPENGRIQAEGKGHIQVEGSGTNTFNPFPSTGQ